MKLCFKCKIEKPLGCFSPSTINKDGFKGTCRFCINLKEKENRRLGIGGDKQRSARYRKNNPEKRKETLNKYNISEKGILSAQIWRDKNRDKLNLKNREFYKKNKLLRFKNSKDYLNRMGQQTPHWIDKSFLSYFKRKRDLMSKKTGITYSIDHIVPLKGKNVSGLNVPWNIQIIPLRDNLRKGTKLVSNRRSWT